jgi:hypothetical protein
MRILLVVLLFAGSLSVHAQTDAMTTLREMQMMIHHAVGTAAEGGGLVAVSTLAPSDDIDQLALDRGRSMILDAKEIVREVASGEAMMALHAQPLDEAANARMIQVHALEQAASAYIRALEQSLADAIESYD